MIRLSHRLAIALLLCGFTISASAHDPDRPDLDGWFMGLRSGKGPCCDGSDALSIADPDWESQDGHYRVHINVSRVAGMPDMQWVVVPDDAVIKEPNRSGRALVWPFFDSSGAHIRCFLPGSMT